jgi:hypothetical protein
VPLIRQCRINGAARQTTDDNIIGRRRLGFWMTKATDTHSEYVILIAFPRHQWLHEVARFIVTSYTHKLPVLLNIKPKWYVCETATGIWC